MATGGRIIPFVAYCPWRQIAYDEKSLNSGEISPIERVKTLILKHGFAGVKLYPPMGFRAINNSLLDGDPKSWPDQSNVPKRFGQKLDSALRDLYDFCIEEDVPLMAHGNESLGSRPGYAARASARFWRELLEYSPSGTSDRPYANLRLNIGHSGSMEDFAERKKWAQDILELLAIKSANVYADFSNFDDMHKSGMKTKLYSSLVDIKNGGRSHILNKIVYGSDWWMLANYKHVKKYPNVMGKLFDDVGAGWRKKMMSSNVMNFLGFQAGDKTYTRLKKYYKKQGIAPVWL